ncbi:MAG: SMI1/KNR4 family protein [Phycisphaeraceae bacterium]|nr:SMI1/KNR4 family protein [Phycisphaerales bacterium]MCB9860019.1 SMI1/KNR4 family protein [Phycisphaeraceae bacterium]
MPKLKLPDNFYRTYVDSPPPAPPKPADFARVEKKLGIKLPASYKAALAEQDGGSLRVDLFRLEKTSPRWYGMGKEYFLTDIAGVVNNKYHKLVEMTESARQWGVEDGLFPIEGDGHTWCCLDYRKNGPKRNPSITHFEPDDGPIDEGDSSREFAVAPSFEALIASAIIPLHRHDYALIALNNGAPRGPKTLQPIMRKLRCKKYNYPGQSGSKDCPLQPAWEWAKYKSVHSDTSPNIPLLVTLENNKANKLSDRKTAEREANHPMLTVNVHPKHEKACLAELLEALGDKAVLIHGVT